VSATFTYAIALAVFFVVMYGIARTLNRRLPEEEDVSFGPPAEIRVLSRATLGRGRNLVIVEVEGRRLLLGSTRSEWTALADLGAATTAGQALNPFAPLDAELARVIQSTRVRRGPDGASDRDGRNN
jgi:flagellar biogenesis protein FliO